MFDKHDFEAEEEVVIKLAMEMLDREFREDQSAILSNEISRCMIQNNMTLEYRRFLGTTQQVQTLKHKHKQEVKNVIVEEIRIRGATIRVHDDSYVNRTKEEIQSSIDACSRIIREALIRKEKTA